MEYMTVACLASSLVFGASSRHKPSERFPLDDILASSMLSPLLVLSPSTPYRNSWSSWVRPRLGMERTWITASSSSLEPTMRLVENVLLLRRPLLTVSPPARLVSDSRKALSPESRKLEDLGNDSWFDIGGVIARGCEARRDDLRLSNMTSSSLQWRHGMTEETTTRPTSRGT